MHRNINLLEDRAYNDVRPEDISNLQTAYECFNQIGKFCLHILPRIYLAPFMMRRYYELDNNGGTPSEEDDWDIPSKAFVGTMVHSVLSSPLAVVYDPKFLLVIGLPLITNLASGAYEGGRYFLKSTKKKLLSEEKQRKIEILQQAEQYEPLRLEEFDRKLKH